MSKNKRLLLSVFAVMMGFLLLAASSYAQDQYSPNSIDTQTPLHTAPMETVTATVTPMETVTAIQTVTPMYTALQCSPLNADASPLPNQWSNPAMCPSPLYRGAAGASGECSDISVRIGDLIQPNKGQVIVALYDANQTGFPWHPENAVRTAVANICPEDNTASAVFTDVPAGDYVVMAYHDADCDNRVDLDIDGIPLEGYAVSGNQKRSLQKPRFDESEVTVNGDRTVFLRMQYSPTF